MSGTALRLVVSPEHEQNRKISKCNVSQKIFSCLELLHKKTVLCLSPSSGEGL